MNENVLYTSHAVSCAYHVSENAISELVAWGVIKPLESRLGKWLFTQKDFERIGHTIRVRKNLCINTPGAALALKFIEEINFLRKKKI